VLNNLSEQRRALIDSFHRSIIQNDMSIERVHANGKVEDVLDKFSLTAQEKKIVFYVEEGLSNRLIGEALSISENTVKSHLQNIFKKVGVTNRLELLKKLEIKN
jgi:DNA-binding CsgD family transcriptional regulator